MKIYSTEKGFEILPLGSIKVRVRSLGAYKAVSNNEVEVCTSFGTKFLRFKKSKRLFHGGEIV